jgi:3',5'-cyclic AMP phosphodiesterase CpdA
MLIVQISDLHVAAVGARVAGVDTAATLARCVEHIAQMDPQPDVVLATGDLTEGGTPAEYLRLRELLAPLHAPVYVIPGNHDDRQAFRAAFSDHAYIRPGNGSIHYGIDRYELGLIALDTTIPGAAGGALDGRQLDWFEGAVRQMAGRPVLVFLHHPPIMTGIRYMDEIALAASSAARLGAVVVREPRIERIVCGHVHRSIQARWHGSVVSICPSTAFQCVLNLRGDTFDAEPAEPPAYQVHYWNRGELVTHTVAVGMGA